MAKEFSRVPSFDDIVFETRNKQYGAYVLRRKYSRNVIISLLLGIVMMAGFIIVPYLNARALEGRQKRAERRVEIKMENLDQPSEQVTTPPPPPPPQEIKQQAKYIPPVVVDSVRPKEVVQLITVDQVGVLKDVDPELDAEVVRVVKTLPKFKPGKQAGKPVPVWYTTPIYFQLK